MSFLKNLQSSAAIKVEKDVIGGGSYLLESGVYDMTIDTAYFDTSKGGAISLNLVLKGAGGENLRQTIYMTSGTAKGCKNTYIDKRDGSTKYLPGFNTANAICLLSNGEEMSEQEIDTKTLKLYDFTARKETPQQKDVIMSLLGQDITVGVLKIIENKNEQNAQGSYVPKSNGATRTSNEIDKVFRTSDQLTVSEINDGATDAAFYAKWSDKNTGNTRDKSAAKAGEVADTQGASPMATAEASSEPKKSLFGK